MFKKPSFKILPISSTTTASNANQDVRPIQNLLSAEKAVLQSRVLFWKLSTFWTFVSDSGNRLQKLSVDYAKSAEALRTWGVSEDNDLGGILTASTSLLNHFSLALSQCVTLGQTMQRQLEVMAKKGENLDNLKQRRNASRQKVEETANQLNKMNPDNKYFGMHADALKRLRKDVRKMDEDVRLEETILNDHKQTATKIWMRLKFSSLHECCEKGVIAGKYGKLAVTELESLEGTEDINQPGMPRNPHLQSKLESFIVEADRHVNAVGLPDVGSRNSDRNTQGSSAGSNIPPQTGPEEPPVLPPKPQPQSQPQYDHASYSQNVQSSRGGNDHIPERQDPYFPPSSSRPYAPSHQQQLSQETVRNPFRTSSSSQQLPRVDEIAVDDFDPYGDIMNNGKGQFSTSAVNTRPPGQSDSGGPSVVNGRRREPSVSESNAGPPHLQEPSKSHWQNPYQYPDHPSQGGRGDSYSAGPSHWQNPPAKMRPSVSSGSGYPPQDPPSQRERGDSYSAGPSHWQNPPVIMRPPASSGYSPQDPPSQSGPVIMRPPASSEYSPQDPPSQSGRQLNGDSSYPTGSSPSDRPPRPPGPSESERYPSQDPPPSLGGRQPMTGTSHWQDRPSAANTHSFNSSEFGGYRSHDPPMAHWQNHPSDRLQIPPPPPTSSLGGRHGNPSHLQVINPSQDSPPLDRRHRESSFSDSPTGSSQQWSSNRFSNISGSTATSEGMTRAREGLYNQTMNAWGGSNPDDSPPAYMPLGNPGSQQVPDTGPKKKW